MSRRFLAVLVALLLLAAAACSGGATVSTMSADGGGSSAFTTSSGGGGHTTSHGSSVSSGRTGTSRDGGSDATSHGSGSTSRGEAGPPGDGGTTDASSKDVAVPTFTIGGTVTGLVASDGGASSLVLEDNGGDNLVVSADGQFTFATPVASGSPYAVTVLTEPGSPSQTCTVTAGAGTVGSANVTRVDVACSTNSYTVGGTLTGLAMGDSVVLADNGGDDLTVTASGAFTFATPVLSGATYAVTVLTQPGDPVQTCTVSGGSATVGAGDVTSVTVNCSTVAFAVGGSISGLAGSVVLTDNGGDDLTVTANGSFAFATPVASGGNYAVAVLTEPGSPAQTCVVSNGSGAVGTGPVTMVSIVCTTNSYTVSVDVTGLSTGEKVVLQDNATDDLTVVANGTGAFATSIESGQPYAVTTLTNPSGAVTETCTATAGSGKVGAANVTVSVTCSPNLYTVTGTLSGLGNNDSVVLQDDAANNTTLTANGPFTFTSGVPSGTSFAVTVLTQPSLPISETCKVTAGSGPVTNANISGVDVVCTANTFTIGGTVSGLAAGDSVTLLDNGGNALTVTGNTGFSFTTPLASGTTYDVTVMTSPIVPTPQACVVTAGTAQGTVTNAAVTPVAVVCTSDGEGAPCTTDSQCNQGWCSTLTSTCVAGQSCKAAQAFTTLGKDHAGLDSCGKGESTDTPAPTHESCCRSLELPAGADATPMRMDKYEVTTGRVRQFVEAVNAIEGSYDLRAWALAEVAAGTPAGVMLSAQMSPAVMNFLPTSNNPSTSLDLPAQLGATSMDANVPSEYQGCYMANGAYGAGDYWQPAATLADFGSPARSFSQADYDIKSMNCAPYWVYAAFCAWDGGRLPTLAEVAAVWGPGQYPWTNATGAAAPFWPNPYPYTTVTTGSGTNYYANIPYPSVNYTVNWNNNSFNDNPGDFYFFPNLGTLTEEPAEVDNGTDLTPYIAAPGRFGLDVTTVKSQSFAGTEGWQDLAANMMEMTLETSTTGGATFCDCGAYTAAEQGTLPACTCPAPGSTPPTKPGVVRATNLPSTVWVGGSWEGHETASPHVAPYLSLDAYTLPIQTQYGKAGFRCVRPAP